MQNYIGTGNSLKVLNYKKTIRLQTFEPAIEQGYTVLMSLTYQKKANAPG